MFQLQYSSIYSNEFPISLNEEFTENTKQEVIKHLSLSLKNYLQCVSKEKLSDTDLNWLHQVDWDLSKAMRLKNDDLLYSMQNHLINLLELADSFTSEETYQGQAHYSFGVGHS